MDPTKHRCWPIYAAVWQRKGHPHRVFACVTRTFSMSLPRFLGAAAAHERMTHQTRSVRSTPLCGGNLQRVHGLDTCTASLWLHERIIRRCLSRITGLCLNSRFTCQLSMRRAYPPIGTCLVTSLTQVMKWRHNFVYKGSTAPDDKPGEAGPLIRGFSSALAITRASRVCPGQQLSIINKEGSSWNLESYVCSARPDRPATGASRCRASINIFLPWQQVGLSQQEGSCCGTGSSPVETPFDGLFHLLPCAMPAADGGEYIADQSLAGCLINTEGNLLHKCSRSRR